MSKELTNESVTLTGSAAGEITLDYNTLKKAVLVLRAVNHPIRKQILELLEENKKMKVTDIFIKLRLEQSVASQHLAILRRAELLNTEREGKFIHYSINNNRMEEVIALTNELAG